MIVFRRMVADRARGACWWAVGTVAAVATTVALWPSIEGNADMARLVEDLPASVQAIIGSQAGISLSSAAGYLQARLFSTVLPVLLVVYAVSLGAQAIGATEEDGTLQLVATPPISRTRIAIERLLAFLCLLVGPVATAIAATLMLGWPVGLLDDISKIHVIEAVLAVGALALMHGCVAFAVGAATGRRGPAVAAASVVAVGGYVLNAAAASADDLSGLRSASPWWWLLERNLLLQAPSSRTFLLPVILGAVACLGGVIAFARRDLRLP